MEGTTGPMTRANILAALEALSKELGRQGVVGEICLLGGTAMILGFAARQTTRDIDAVFEPAAHIRRAAGRVADEMGLTDHWLNDGAKAFLSSRHEVTAAGLPQFPFLKLSMPVPEYMLAMKCLAARIGGGAEDPSDVADIRLLLRHLRIPDPETALSLVERYYGRHAIPVRTQYLIEGLFEDDGEKTPDAG